MQESTPEGYDDYSFKKKADFITLLGWQYNMCREQISQFNVTLVELGSEAPEDALLVLIIMLQNKNILDRCKMTIEQFKEKIEEIRTEYAGKEKVHQKILAEFKFCQDIMEEAHLLDMQMSAPSRM